MSAVDRSSSSKKKKNNFLVLPCGGERSSGLWVMVLKIFRIGLRESNKSQEYVYLLYTETTFPINIVKKTTRSVGLR